ncbi:hypothetical protein [Agrococcus carbonis]|uniref:DUF4381 domain-containing protein n=1 Tax=Agrococcus carbonis TaxID=684552 RepID=A0A1H1SCC5_9MICO|nr:hypothetical protein [Agrococcus carbonis]SDS45458.1 hypothetical protein SAMN04489719_2359 [Agrococcus carbonis]
MPAAELADGLARLPAPDTYGPFGYGPWWVLGAAALLLVATAYALAWAWTRPRGILTPPPPPVAPIDVRSVKQKYLGMIDEVAAEHAAGELEPRALAQRLSLVLRFFAHESTGVVAEVMTLRDLGGADLPTVEGAVAQYYPASFRRAAKHDPDAAIAAARQVVATWM